MNKLQASLAISAYVFALTSQAALFDDKEARKKILEVEANTLANHELQSAQIEGLSKRTADEIAGLGKRTADEIAGLSKRTAGQLLGIHNEMALLMQEISELRGAVEVASHALSTTDKRQKDLYTDTDRRIRKLESSLGGDQVSELAPPNTAGADDAAAYKAAYGFSQKASHYEAFEAYNDFIANYPDSKYMPDAFYGLGYSQFALKNYKSSIATQEKLLAIYPDSTKAPKAMYSIANSQIQLGQVNSAKKVLRSLLDKHPSATLIPNAKKRLKVLESIK
ncbi:MAG: YbgF trimerization domain-containing protein [Methylophilaceae bacterium]